MLRIKILVTTCLLIFTIVDVNAQSGWQVQFESNYAEFYDIYFINEYTGWAISSEYGGKVVKTTNKGINWTTITYQQFNSANGISFYDELNGWICTSGGQLYRTTNGAYNWIHSNCTSCSNVDDFQDIQFINQMTGWAYGDAHIFKTSDGGLNYFQLNCGQSVLNGFFLDSLNGWVCGYLISKSSDGGISWFQCLSLGFQASYIYFVNLYKGWLCSYNGKIFRTTNSGENWNLQYNNNSYSLYKIQFVNEDTGWVIGDSGTVLKTTNSGINWFKQTAPILKNFKGIHMISSIEGWLCGDKYILYTTDGGGPIGIRPISNELPNKFSLYQNYPNPFNPQTKIKFDIPPVRQRHSARGGFDVRLVVYDALGREIATLVNEELKPGTYEVFWDGSNYPSGVYFYKLSAGDYLETKKMILLK